MKCIEYIIEHLLQTHYVYYSSKLFLAPGDPSFYLDTSSSKLILLINAYFSAFHTITREKMQILLNFISV